MANFSVNPAVLNQMNLLGRGTYVLLQAAPGKSGKMQAMGNNAGMVAQFTAKTEQEVQAAVLLADLLRFTKKTGVYNFEVEGNALVVEADNLRAKFPLVDTGWQGLSWQEGDFSPLTSAFAQLLARFSRISDVAGSLPSAVFLRDGHFIVTDGAQYLKAEIEGMPDLILPLFDHRLLEGMTEYLVEPNRVIFSGGKAQLMVSRLDADYPPDLNPQGTIVKFDLTLDQLETLPGAYITLFTHEDRLVAQSEDGYEVTLQLGECPVNLYCRFNKNGIKEGMVEGGELAIQMLGTMRVLTITKEGHKYLLAEYLA